MDNDYYGVRIYKVDEDVILVKQTIKKPTHNAKSARYVVDMTSDGTHKEKHVDINDDRRIADAVRQALNGRL